MAFIVFLTIMCTASCLVLVWGSPQRPGEERAGMAVVLLIYSLALWALSVIGTNFPGGN